MNFGTKNDAVMFWLVISLVGVVVLCSLYNLSVFIYRKRSKKYLAKEEREREYQEAKNKIVSLKKAYQDMLIVKSQLKIINSSTKEVIEKEYSDFISSHKHADDAVVGDFEKGMLFSMQEPEISFKDGTYVMVIKFKRYELKDGKSNEEYSSAVEEYENFINSIYQGEFNNE